MYSGKVVNRDYLLTEIKRLCKENLALRESIASNPLYKTRIQNKIDSMISKDDSNKDAIWILQSLLD